MPTDAKNYAWVSDTIIFQAAKRLDRMSEELGTRRVERYKSLSGFGRTAAPFSSRLSRYKRLFTSPAHTRWLLPNLSDLRLQRPRRVDCRILLHMYFCYRREWKTQLAGKYCPSPGPFARAHGASLIIFPGAQHFLRQYAHGLPEGRGSIFR